MNILHALVSQMQTAMSSQLVGGGLVLMFTGSVVALCRNTPGRVWAFFYRRFTSVVTIQNRDPLFDFVVFWLDSQERFRKSRSLFAITESRIAQNREESSSPVSIGAEKKKKPMRIFFSPSRGSHYIMREGRWIRITREVETKIPSGGASSAVDSAAGGFQRPSESFAFTGFGKSQALIKQLILEIVEFGTQPNEGIRVYFSTYGYWQCLGRRKMRSLESVILPTGLVESLLADAKEFLSKELWYREVGIPWHRGYLFHGVPGSGKTSIASALAGALGLDLYVLNIGGSQMNDEKLASLMSDVNAGSVIVMEDVDCTIPDRNTEANKVTLSGLLNCLDGIMSREGCIIIMTTNFRKAIDEALLRPGRVDVEMEFTYANHDQKMRLAAVLGGEVPEGLLTMAQCQQAILRSARALQEAGR